MTPARRRAAPVPESVWTGWIAAAPRPGETPFVPPYASPRDSLAPSPTRSRPATPTACRVSLRDTLGQDGEPRLSRPGLVASAAPL